MNRFTATCLFWIVLNACPWPSSARAWATDAPVLLRLAVIDNSGSMAGERIASVREELTKLARQLPPSDTHPIILIKFGNTAAPPVLFTELAPFEAAVGLLQGDSGGTNIAAGLDASVQQLNRYKTAQDVWILLYSDGEDANQAAIAKAESQLDAIFADRQQQQLPQTVFCKRWGGSNAELLSQLRQHGRATVIDAGELQLRPLTFNPVIEVTSVAWNLQTPDQLEITYSARVDVQGDTTGLSLPTMTAECQAAHIQGDIETEVVPADTNPSVRTLSLQVSSADRNAGELLLPFEFTPPGDITTQNAKVLPQLSASRVEVPVKLPTDKYTYRVVSEMNPEAGTWVDALARRVRYPVKLKFTVTCQQGVDHSPGDLEIIPESGTVLISGPPVLNLPGSGMVEADYVVETTVKHIDQPREAWLCEVAFTGHPVNTPSNLTFEPATWDIRGEAAIPAPITTVISGKVLSVSPPQWTNLAQGTAHCDVETEFDVQGPIAPKTVLNLLTSGAVVDLDIEPGVIRSGTQKIRLSLSASLRPSPQAMTFETCILVPQGDGVISYQAGPPLSFSVTGPAAVPLSLAKRGRPIRELQATIADNDRHVRLSIEPIVAGFDRTLLGDLDVVLSPHASALTFPSSATYRVARTQSIDVAVTAPEHRPFFRDVALTGTMDVEPAQAQATVKGLTIPIRVILAAPFKRLALYLAVGLSLLATGIVTVRMYLALRRAD